MTSFYPDSEFYLTNLNEASALGAAITAKVAYEKIDIKSLAELISIDKKLLLQTTSPALRATSINSFH